MQPTAQKSHVSDEKMDKKESSAYIPDYTLVIPAYNEKERIGAVLDELKSSSGRFIFIFDGDDRTPDIILDFSRRNPGIPIHVERHNKRRGKGKAILEGFRIANTPIVGFMDADGSTSIREMERLVSEINARDGAIGSRWLPGSRLPRKQGFSRRIQSRIFNLIIRILFGLSFKDTQCGAKVFKKSAIDAVIGDMVSSGFEFDVELLWRLSRKGYAIREVPIKWTNMSDSRVTRSDAGGMLAGLLKLRIHG